MTTDRLDTWLTLWRQAQPVPRKGKLPPAEWQAAIEKFIGALQKDLATDPLSWWQKVRLLHRLQKSLSAAGLPGEALRPLVLAIILRVYLA